MQPVVDRWLVGDLVPSLARWLVGLVKMREGKKKNKQGSAREWLQAWVHHGCSMGILLEAEGHCVCVETLTTSRYRVDSS